MSLFDRYIAVDWSANNRPKAGKDSIWIAELSRDGALEVSRNPRTRHAAIEHLIERLELTLERGERTLVGFDFPFGYPVGVSAHLAGHAGWESLWLTLALEVTDGEDNRSNRFEVAARFNERLGKSGARFWGCPAKAGTKSLSPRKVGATFDRIGEFRHVERVAKGAKPIWQLHYNGSVGSQCILGIAWLQRLRGNGRFGTHIAVWPFETDFERNLAAPLIFAEIYPSMIRELGSELPKDRAQVEAQVWCFASWDRAGYLSTALSYPSSMDIGPRTAAVQEEGWIVGAGHEGLAV